VGKTFIFYTPYRAVNCRRSFVLDIYCYAPIPLVAMASSVRSVLDAIAGSKYRDKQTLKGKKK